MGVYNSSGSGDIGNLLRLIQEEKATSVLANPPAAEPGAPIRGVVQQPLQSPNDPGSSRVVSTPAEAVAPGGAMSGQPGGVVAPVAAAPIAPVAPSNPGQPSGGGQPSNNQPSNNGIKLGTSLTNNPVPQVAGASTKSTNSSATNNNNNLLKLYQQFIAPLFRTRFGSPIVYPQGSKKPAPTPTPSQGKRGQQPSGYRGYTA